MWKTNTVSSVSTEGATLKEKTIKETVITPGTLKLRDEQTVYYQPEKGEIAEVFVKEGDSVKKGTKLLRYENKQLELDKKQNELQLKSLYLDMDNMKEKHQEIDKQVKEDKENEMLKDEHDQVELQIQQTNIELEQTLLQKDNIDQQMNELIVKSDIEGTVVTINEQTAPGSESLQQMPLMQIGSLDNLAVEGLISEYDTLKIKEGQPVELTSDAVADKSWKGKVGFISYLPKESENMVADGTSGVEYPVEVIVEDKQIDLKPGFQMLIEIEIDKKKAQTLPIAAVKQDGDVNYVYVIDNGISERREVEVGMVSGEEIEIKDGLKKKEKVVADPSDTLKDGMEVTLE